MSQKPINPVSRRAFMRFIGLTGGSALMYDTMVAMGYAGTSDFNGPIKLSGDVKGATVLILGAGLAGMTAAYELRKAGYKVQLLEYNDRPGGRNWSLYGGDSYTDIGGVTQKVQFAPGLYFNPGPWRLPHHHRGILYYCKQLNVALETFTMTNYNAYIHSTKAFGGKPLRRREVDMDFSGYVAELLAKATSQNQLSGALSKDEKDGLLQILRFWGALDKNYEYKKGPIASELRGYAVQPGGGLMPPPVDSDPLPMKQLFASDMWGFLEGRAYDYQTQLFEPVGGMGMIGKAFGKALTGSIKYNCKVIDIKQDAKGVVATYVDSKKGGAPQTARGDWCICTIPASVLSQIPMNVAAPMRNAINSLSYESSFKVGLQFKRRFWEEDDDIYGGISYTDQPITNISYPSTGFFKDGPAVLLGGYGYGNSLADFSFAALPPDQQVQSAVEQGSKIHPQYKKEFMNGVAVAWHRVPFTLGCAGSWTEEGRAKHYNDMCAIDGRIMLAGEHCSRLPAWQEGAILSALDAIGRLHKRVTTA
ncbi:MAG TPA: FAD-dependent oxidoreductase [Rhizomicrobium sp.]|nr:FAD-dependent oxidoreductase [Rhizomicrobium sp.]